MSISCPSFSELNQCSQVPRLKEQRTLKNSISAHGIGIFTGEQISIRVCPGEEDSGILFQRTDLPQRPIFPAKLEFVKGTPRCTIIGDHRASIQTVEHILAAFKGCGIDNAFVEISGSEVPIFDGSALRFVEMIEEAGVVELGRKSSVRLIDAPIFWSEGDIHLIALPSEDYRISYTLHYPDSQLIRSQFYSIVVGDGNFKKEIAPCRTFSVYEQIAPMIEKGLVKGGSLDNAVIIKDDVVVNPEGLRFPDEMVRHKVLDLIGDLSLVPVPFLAHIIAIRSGHASNNAFAQKLFNHINMENS